MTSSPTSTPRLPTGDELKALKQRLLEEHSRVGKVQPDTIEEYIANSDIAVFDHSHFLRGRKIMVVVFSSNPVNYRLFFWGKNRLISTLPNEGSEVFN